MKTNERLLTMNLPKTFSYLTKEPGPRMLLRALELFGTKEVVGSGDNPEILAWAKECAIPGYSADSIPWCGLFMAVIAHRAGKTIPSQPLWAQSWIRFGEESKQAELGDVLVFKRPGGGHVGLYVGEDAHCYFVLGGNQGDSVSIVPVLQSRCIGIRRSYRVTPDNVRKIVIKSSQKISKNEE